MRFGQTNSALQSINGEYRVVGLFRAWKLGGMLTVGNKRGVVTFGVAQSNEGSGIMGIRNAQGKSTITVTHREDGSVFLRISNKQGNPTFEVIHNDDGGVVSLYNNSGEVVVQLSADGYGNGVVGAIYARARAAAFNRAKEDT